MTKRKSQESKVVTPFIRMLKANVTTENTDKVGPLIRPPLLFKNV